MTEKSNRKPNITCDFCGKAFHKKPSEIRRRKLNFCCPQCRYFFSNKKTNPEKYREYRDLTALSVRTRQKNLEDNPAKRPEIRKKIHETKLNTGQGKSYRRYYCRLEHRVVAEQILGRPMLPGEVVHHIDGNKRNNDPGNIFVFASQSEHVRYHNNLRYFIKSLEEMEKEEAEVNEV